jgi:hypothetical protein
MTASPKTLICPQKNEWGGPGWKWVEALEHIYHLCPSTTMKSKLVEETRHLDHERQEEDLSSLIISCIQPNTEHADDKCDFKQHDEFGVSTILIRRSVLRERAKKLYYKRHLSCRFTFPHGRQGFAFQLKPHNWTTIACLLEWLILSRWATAVFNLQPSFYHRPQIPGLHNGGILYWTH